MHRHGARRIFSAGSGQLEFEEFVTLAAQFLVEDEVEDQAAMQEELKEAFRLYDKEGRCNKCAGGRSSIY